MRTTYHVLRMTILMMRKTKDDAELADFGRFSEPALLILVSLAEGPRHGYSIAEDIEAIAGVRLGPGTLYGACLLYTSLDERILQSGSLVPILRARHTARAPHVGTNVTITFQTKSAVRAGHCPASRKIGFCSAVPLLAAGAVSRSVISVSAGMPPPVLFALLPLVMMSAMAPASHMLI